MSAESGVPEVQSQQEQEQFITELDEQLLDAKLENASAIFARVYFCSATNVGRQGRIPWITEPVNGVLLYGSTTGILPFYITIALIDPSWGYEELVEALNHVILHEYPPVSDGSVVGAVAKLKTISAF